LRALGLRGVSEYTATLIVAIITLAAGAAIFIYSYRLVDTYYSALATATQEAEQSTSIAILATYINSSKLVVIGSTGSRPATLYAVYINESLAARCNVTLTTRDTGAGQLPQQLYTVPSYRAFVIVCSLSSQPSSAKVKLVFNGGEAVAWATRVR
jgi:hypothetical protein